MNKPLDMLEKNVEWIAMALGIAFLGLMVYLYLFSAPVTGSIGGVTLAPGEMDAKIDSTSAQKVSQMISQGTIPNIHLQPSGFVDAMNLKNFNPPMLASAFDVQYFRLSGQEKLIGPVQTVQVVNAVPTPPAGEYQGTETGRSSIALANAPAAPAAGGAAAAAVAAAANANRVDIDWLTVFFSIPRAPLMAQWQTCFGARAPGAAPLLNPKDTKFIVVELIRQEKNPAGGWNPEKVIPRLSNQQLPAPLANGNKQQNLQFAKAMDAHQLDLIAPPFFTLVAVNQGDPWRSLDQWNKYQAELAAPVAPKVAPVSSSPPPGSSSTPPRNPRQPRTPPSSGSGSGKPVPGQGSGVMPFNQPQQNAHPPAPLADSPDATDQSNKQLQDFINRRFGPPPGGGGQQPLSSEQEQQQAAARQQQQAAERQEQQQQQPPMQLGAPAAPGAPPANPLGAGATAGLPAGPFDPTALISDIPVYLHDATVTPGQTYRYKLRYKLFNPLYPHGANIVAPNAIGLINQFTLDAPDSAWSPEITVNARTRFYCSKVQPAIGQFAFDVYTWANGTWHAEKCIVSPGDPVGETKPGADFSTGWTMLELRDDPRAGRSGHKEAILVNDATSAIKIIDVQKDQNSQEHQNYIDLTKQAPGVPAAPAAPAPPAAGSN